MLAISIIVLFVWISKLIVIKGSNEVFNQCVRSTPNPGLIKCIGQQTLSSLHYIDKIDNFTITNGLELVRTDAGRERSLTELFVDDPTDFRYMRAINSNVKRKMKIFCIFFCHFRGLLENAGTLIGQRSLQWDLSVIEPGLQLRIGPTAQANSVLEFAMTPSQDRDRYSSEEPSTGNIRIENKIN